MASIPRMIQNEKLWETGYGKFCNTHSTVSIVVIAVVTLQKEAII